MLTQLGILSCKRRYRYVNERLRHFWKRWHREYLTDLRESHDCNAKKAAKEPTVGDVVIVFDEGAKRNSWKTAVIEDLIPGKDNQVRGAHLRMITKRKAVRLSRPIQKLYPIEVRESSTNLPRSQEKQVERERTLRRRVIPRRTAALDAVWKTREMINQSDDYSLRADDKNTLIITVCEVAQRSLFWTTNGLNELPEVRFEFPFNLIGDNEKQNKGLY